MHNGNLAGVMMVKHLANAVYNPIVLVGGATGMIGDPKQDVERDLNSGRDRGYSRRHRRSVSSFVRKAIF